MYLDLTVDLSHSEHCFEWDRCDDCYEDLINSQVSEIEPVISESYGRKTIQDDKHYAGYSPADRKHQMLDMTDNLSDVTDAWIIYQREIQCSRCNLMYHSAIGQCPNC